MLSIQTILHSSQIYLLQSIPYVSRRFRVLSIHTEKCTAIRFIGCSQCRLRADESVCWAYGKLCSLSRFFVAQFLAFWMSFWSHQLRLSAFFAWQLRTAIFQCCLKFFSPFCRRLEFQSPIIFGGFHPFLHISSVTRLSKHLYTKLSAFNIGPHNKKYTGHKSVISSMLVVARQQEKTMTGTIC